MIAVMLSAAAVAQPAPTRPVALSGDLRWIGSSLTDFPVDGEGTTLGQGAWLDQRLRIGGAATPDPRWTFSTEWDLFTGQLAGDRWAVPGEIDARHREAQNALSLDGIRPRRLAATVRAGDFQLEAGLVTSSWGLGMVANDGADDPLFGRSDFGDRVVRLRASRIPDGLANGRGVILTAAADWVVQDDTASFRDDQLAFQGIASALAIDGDRKFGTYLVFRHQLEADRTRTTDAGVIDAYATAPTRIGAWTFAPSVEVAGILGRTDRATTYEARQVVGIASLGAAGQLTLTDPTDLAAVHLRAGYASGDGNPDDGVSHDFTFDRDFGVGMVLFDQVLGGVEAASYVQLVDPTHVGQAPDGVDAVVTEGAFRRAAFVAPAAELTPGPLLLAGGVMFAVATTPYAQPYYTFREGGTPYNQHDLPSEGRLLGTELDWRAGVAGGPDDALSVVVEGGHLILGRPLRGAGPNVIHLATLTGRIRW